MRLFIGLDTETTGLDVMKGHRVIEFFGQVYRKEDRATLLTLESRFSNEGKAIDKKAQAVHGIAAADLIGQPRFETFAPKLAKVFESVKGVVAHNAQFDIGFLAHHMAEAGYPLPEDLIIFDTMLEGMTASYDSKAPSLREFCWAMGVEYDPAKAHAADYDVKVMMDAFFVALDRGHFTLPATMTEKEAA
ncbi:MAG: 3'-5' exonuclease [Rhodobacterales bacterium]|nr:3'-5' exonuclease [Rhodobacterales bacterium]